jgi:small subunit ribosomal protein S24e
LKFQIENKSENKLLERTELSFSVEHPGESTPTRDSVRSTIASSMSVPKERIIVDQMETEYGIGLTKGYAKVYDSQESLMKSERFHLLVRNNLAEKKVKAATTKKARPAPKAK